MKDDIHVCLLFVLSYIFSTCDFRLVHDVLTYPVIKDHLRFAVANKFIGVLWVEGDICLA